jgi:DMSO/TMAO reductase YedYZ molybdopterin-dependent catalytic subunit
MIKSVESFSLTRRGFVSSLAVGGGLLLTGCDALGDDPQFRKLLKLGEDANYAVHRSLQDRMALAKEFPASQRSPIFRANGTRMPVGDAYARHIATEFRDWTLTIDGLVDRPYRMPIDQIRSMPTRHQITRHDCVEGWSAIAKWSGVPVKLLLDKAGVKARARFIVIHCADVDDGTPWYESFDLIDAYHPQTILAWNINDEPLPIPNGAPLRLRVERQLGYKQAKYVQRIQLVDSLKPIYGGKGGYWEDVAGYEWYAGA